MVTLADKPLDKNDPIYTIKQQIELAVYSHFQKKYSHVFDVLPLE